MSHFKIKPLALALFTITTTPAIANTTNPESQNVNQLSTIVVSAAGFEQDIKNAPASISVVTKEDIEKKNATSIADLLSDVPGVDIRNGVGKTGNLNIGLRGMGSEYTLILIDGRRQTTSSDVTPNGFSDTFSGYLPPLSTIERIEVIRGPMATRYGSEAMGGVINIITKKVSDEWTGNVTLSGNLMEHKGEADSWKSSFVLNGPLINDRLGLQIRGSYLDRQESERITGTTGRDPRPSKADNYDIGAKLDFKLNDQNHIWIDGFESTQKYPNTDNRLGTQDTPTQANGYKDKLQFDRSQISIGHDGDYDFGVWKTYLSQTETETIGRTIPNGTFKDGAFNGANRNLTNTDLVFDTNLVLPIGQHKVTVGAEYKEAKIEDDIAGIGSEFKKDSWSVYLENEWSILDNLNFTLGGRYEDHSGFGGQFSPRGYLVWNATDEVTFKGGVSTGYKTPSPKALYDGIISVSGQGASFGVGSPDLKPEESINYELGFYYTNNDNFDFSSTVFYSKISDLIVSGNPTPNCNFIASPNRPNCVSYGSQIVQDTFAKNVNADEAESKGLELSLKYSIIPEWDIRTAYTLMETEITKGSDKGAYYNNTPKHALNTTSTWHINSQIDLWLQHEYRSNKDRFKTQPTAPATGIGSSDYEEFLIFGNELSGYNLFNLGGSYSYSDNLRFNMAVNNLLDKDFTRGNQSYEYLDNRNRPQTATGYKYLDVGSSTSGTYLSGRNYWLSISYDF